MHGARSIYNEGYSEAVDPALGFPARFTELDSIESWAFFS